MMELLVFIIGLCVGSFLGVLVDRLSKDKSIQGRSHCEFCKKTLHWNDLIPLLSFVLLKGRCRYCRKKLSIYYPLMEVITGIIFLTTYSLVSIFSLEAINYHVIYYLAVSSFLIVVFFSDLKYGIIPDKILIPSTVLVLVYQAINYQLAIFNYLIVAAVTFFFFLFLFLITKGKGMGFGDVKYAFLMGLLLGFPNIVVALYMAFLTGAFVSIILILWKGKHLLKKTIPFGPFLALSTFISMFWGNMIWQKFVALLF